MVFTFLNLWKGLRENLSYKADHELKKVTFSKEMFLLTHAENCNSIYALKAEAVRGIEMSVEVKELKKVGSTFKAIVKVSFVVDATNVKQSIADFWVSFSTRQMVTLSVSGGPNSWPKASAFDELGLLLIGPLSLVNILTRPARINRIIES